MSLAWSRSSLRSPCRESNPDRQASEACAWCRQIRGERQNMSLPARSRTSMTAFVARCLGRQDRERWGPARERVTRGPGCKLVGSAAEARASGKERRSAERPGVPSGIRTRVSGVRTRLPWPSSRMGTKGPLPPGGGRGVRGEVSGGAERGEADRRALGHHLAGEPGAPHGGEGEGAQRLVGLVGRRERGGPEFNFRTYVGT